MIGSYSKPDEDGEIKVLDKREPQAPTPERTMATGIKEDLASDVAKTEKAVEKIKDYKEILKEAGIDLNEAIAIVDDILTNGFHEETLLLTKNASVIFRTRSQADYIRYHRAVEAFNPRYQDEMQEIASRYCLAGSLVRFGETLFEHPQTPTADKAVALFDARLDWIEAQPERIISLLGIKLNKFDIKIQTVMSEGVIENF